MAQLLPYIVEIPFGSKKHQDVLTYVMDRVYASRNRRSKREEKWRESEDLFTSYVHETDADALRRGKRDSQGIPQYTTVTIPYSYATLMTAHAYWTSVFLSRDPILQVQGMSGEAQTSEMAVESVLQHYIIAGRNLVSYFIWLLDQGKYGEGVIGTCWDIERSFIPEVREVPRTFMGMAIPNTKTREWTSKEVIGYEGLKNFNVRPADFLFDPTVTLQNFQKGEFAGHEAFVPLLKLKDGEAIGKYYNVQHVEGRIRSQRAQKTNGNSSEMPGTDAYGGLFSNKLTPSGCDLIEITLELSPRELSLANREYLEKWSFTIANDNVIVSAQPQGFYHNEFMYDTLEHEIEGYNVSKRGMMEMLKPLNVTLDWLINAHFYNVRKTLNNEFIYDPSVLVEKDVKAPGPGKLIRVRPDAFGKNVKDSFFQLQTVDVTQGNIKDAMLIIEMMQRLTGVNDSVMGMVNSGRRSATEIRTSTSMAVNRLKTQCEYYSAMGFGPHTSRAIKTSQQMLQGRPGRFYRMVGNQAEGAGQFLMVGPDDIAGQYDYLPVDGTMPIDRSAQATVFTQMLQQMAQIPPVAQAYDWVKLFGYAAQMQGVRNLQQFKVQVVPDAQAAAGAAAGNLVPMSQMGGGMPMGAGPDNVNNGAGIDAQARQ